MLGTLHITATSGNNEIIDSGTVITFGNEPMEFSIPPDLRIRMAFLNDNEINSPHSIRYNQISNQYLEIQLYNFNNPLGTGNIEPLQLGTLDNRTLFLNIRVHFLNNSQSRTIHYTFYLQNI